MYTNAIAKENNLEAMYQFCRNLQGQDAKMTFAFIENINTLKAWFEDPNIYMYLSLTQSGEIAGMFRAKRGQGNKNHSVDIACAVDKNHRKKQIATKLTIFGLEDVKLHGVLIARTYIYSWNKASIATIKKAGFIESGRKIMHQYEASVGDYIDDVIFYKKL